MINKAVLDSKENEKGGMQNNPVSYWRTTALVAGSFTFVFLLGEMVHEFGHYLAHLAYGTQGVSVTLDPFGSSHIAGVEKMPLNAMAVTSAAGPLFNLLLGVGMFLLLWPRRSPRWLPLLLWGPVAMIQEGVTFSLGLLTPGGDADWIAAAGVPRFLVIAFGAALLVGGLAALTALFPQMGITEAFSGWQKYTLVLVGMGTLMLVRALHGWLMAPAQFVENLVPFVFSLVLAALLVVINRPISRIIKPAAGLASLEITRGAAAAALLFGVGMFLFQVLILNGG